MSNRTLKIETQLAGMAASAERANRPTAFVVLCALVLVAAAAYLVASYMEMSARGRRLLASNQAAADAISTLGKIEAWRASYPDLEEEFPPDSFFVASLQEYAREAGVEEDVVGAVRNGTDQRRGAGRNSPLITEWAEWRFTDQPLPIVLDFVNRVLADDEQGQPRFTAPQNVYLAALNLTALPTAETWRVTVKFEMLQHKR